VNRCPRNVNVSCPAREIRIDKRTQEKRRQTIINKTKTHKTKSHKKEPEKSGLKSQNFSAKMSIF
jgi:hypothetical protein